MAFRFAARSLTAAASTRPLSCLKKTRKNETFLRPTAKNSSRNRNCVNGVLYGISLGGLASIFDKDGEDESGEEDEKTKKGKKELIGIIKQGILARNKGDFDHAERMLHIALRMAQDLRHYDAVTYVYDQMANVAFERV